MSRRLLDPESAADIGKLDPEAIARVREEAWPDASTPDELHDALLWLTFVTDEEVAAQSGVASADAGIGEQRRGQWCAERGAGLWPDARTLYGRVQVRRRIRRMPPSSVFVAAERVTLFKTRSRCCTRSSGAVLQSHDKTGPAKRRCIADRARSSGRLGRRRHLRSRIARRATRRHRRRAACARSRRHRDARAVRL